MGLEGHGQTGRGATYDGASVTSATTRTRGADGAWETVEPVFARRASSAGGTLRRGRGLEKAHQKAQDHTPSSSEEPGTLPAWLWRHDLIIVHSHGQVGSSRTLLLPPAPTAFCGEAGTPVCQAEGPEASLGLGPSTRRQIGA